MTALTNVARMPGRLSRQRRLGMATLAVLAAVSVGAGATSLAIFTDSAESTGTFTSGTIDITSSPTVAFTVAAMMPGDVDTEALTIANAGTGALRYSLATVATNTLGDALTLTVKTLGTSCAVFDGTSVLAATPLDGAAIGNPTQGADAGDRVLAAATSEVLCFRVSLPLATDNTAQGISSAVTFTFDAEQTANN
jgi:spore coat-associated protein N